MKKLLALVLTVVMAMGVLSLTACKDADDTTSTDTTPQEVTMTGIEYLSGLGDIYIKNSEMVITELKINELYSDNTKIEVAYNDKDFEVTADLSKVNSKAPVTINYKGYTCTTEVAVTDQYDLSAIEVPEFLLISKANKELEDIDDNNGFKDNTQAYCVGDDNPFVFRPTINAMVDFEGSPELLGDIQGFDFNISLEVKDGENYVAVDKPETYATIDRRACSIDFAETAVSKDFRVTFYPEGILSDAQLSNPKFVKTLELSVVDAYNISTIEGFSLIDNTFQYEGNKHIRKEGNEWKEKRDHAGIKADASKINGIVLHNNISVKSTDLPSSLLFNESDSEINPTHKDYDRVVGSLRDGKQILHRFVKPGEQFAIYGNYFNVDGAGIPMIVRDRDHVTKPMDEDEVVVSHSVFMYFDMDGTPSGKDAQNRELVSVKNLSLKGNSQREETSVTGGCIMFKSAKVNTLLYNIIARQWYLTVFTNYNDEYNPITIEKNKYYDNYNSILYSWGGHFNVKDSVMKGAGGPVYIADHCNYHPDDSKDYGVENGFIPGMNFDEKCVLESYVVGDESWFQQMKATAAGGLVRSLDGGFNQLGNRSFLVEKKNVKYFNFVGLHKSGYAEGMTSEKVSGRSVIGTHVMDMQKPCGNDEMKNSVLYEQGFNGKTVLFQSKGDLVAIYDQVQGVPGQVFVDAFTARNAMAQGQPVTPNMITPPTHDLFKIDESEGAKNYLNLYFGNPQNTSGGYMGIILGDYHAIG